MPKSTTLRSTKSRTATVSAEAPTPRTEIQALPSIQGRDGAPPDGAIAERRLPTHEEIAARAYSISEARRQRGEDGDEMSDWLHAEAELLGGTSTNAPTS
jgi:hypothetical protein